MPDEPRILDYSKPPPSGSRAADALRLIGGVICFFSTLLGLGIIAVGSSAFIQIPTTPSVDRPYLVLVGTVICLIGLVTTVFSVRWLLNALRPRGA